jgi:ribonuclease PH
LECNCLKNGSVIALIDSLVPSKHLLLSCSVNAHPHPEKGPEENQGVTKLG